MAIAADQLYVTARARQIRLHVQRVIESNRRRIGRAGSQRGELRMVMRKAFDVRHVVRKPSACRQIRVALRAARVAHFGQANRSAVIGVARGARRREGLRRVVNRPIVAIKASVIGNFPAEENTGNYDVAGAASI
jgi:hypothetical protein